MAKRGSKRRNREEDVVQAAIDVFWERGYPEASMQDVAEVVGVLKGSLYYYISSKEELLFRLFEVSHEQATEIMSGVASSSDTAIERFVRYVRDYVVWYLTNIRRVTIYHRDWRYLTEERLAKVRKQRRAVDDFVRELVTEAREDGDVPSSIDPTLATFFVLGSVTSLPDWYRPDGPRTIDEIADAYADHARAVLTTESA